MAPKPLKIDMKKVPILVMNSICIDVLNIIRKISRPNLLKILWKIVYYVISKWSFA